MAGCITSAQWLLQYATLSQVEDVLRQRDRLLSEGPKLRAVADAARAFCPTRIECGPIAEGVDGNGPVQFISMVAPRKQWKALHDALGALDG